MPKSIADYETLRGWWADTGQKIAPSEWPLARAIQEGIRTLNTEIEIERADTTRAALLISAAPMYDAEGRLIGAVSVRQDITERRKMEAALRESEARFRLALKNAPIAMCTCDRDLRYTWVYNSIMGLDVDAMPGKRDDELLPLAAAAELMALKQSAMESEDGLSGEIQVTIDGRTYCYVMNIEPLRAADGQVMGIIGAALDISEQRQLEARHLEYTMQVEVQRRLLEHREMERQMIARELHDGPIQNLIGLLFLVQSVLDHDPGGEVGAALHNVRDGAQTLVSELRIVCNDLRPPSLVQFGLARAIRSHAEDFQTRNSNVDLHLDLMEDGRSLPDSVRLALYRIYQEGLNNIMRHAQATIITVRLGLDAQGVVLELADNGRGFVFSEEWVDLARHGHLGLVGMRERAEAIGGKLSVTSEPGAGTLLRVEVPRGI